MKKNVFIFCLLILILCTCSCDGKTTVTENSVQKTNPNALSLYDDSPPATLDGKETIAVLIEPFEDEVIESVLSDKDFIHRCDLTYGADYHLSDQGFYCIDIQKKCVLHYCYHIPVIRNDLMIGWASIYYMDRENGGAVLYQVEYNPRVENPEHPITRDVKLLCLEKLNTLLKENPEEHYIILINAADYYLLDSNNELHSLQSTIPDNITILNQDYLYADYFFAESTISADMITSD